MSAGDGHIWTATTGPVPLAECGYSPPVEDILADPVGDDDPVVVGQQVVHAEPTGVPCDECREAVAPDPDPED